MYPTHASFLKRKAPYIVEHFPCARVLSSLTWLDLRDNYECTRKMFGKVFESLEVINVAPTMYVEVLGEVRQEPVLCRAGGEVVWSNPGIKLT